MALDVQERWIVLQDKVVLQPRWLEGGWFKEELYCKRVKCIAIEAA